MEQTTLKMIQLTLDLIEQYPYDADISELTEKDFTHDRMLANLQAFLEDCDYDTADFEEARLIARIKEVVNEIVDSQEYEIKIDAVDNTVHHKQYITLGTVKKILAILDNETEEK